MPDLTTRPGPPDHDVVVIGAGFSGLYCIYRLRQMGLRVHVLERGSDVGGTWYWNRYPGARCDIESVDYSYSFSPELRDEWVWSERYAAQPEILSYLNHVADRFDLRRDITFNTTVMAAEHVKLANRWEVTSEDGRVTTATYLVMAVGNLSEPKPPHFEGLEEFEGQWHHTARWPADGVDFTGKRVGVMGTGSTGIQAIPRIAGAATEVHVFQRTPSYSMPARNRPLEPAELREVNRDYDSRRHLCEQSDAGVPMPPPTVSAFDVDVDERRRMYEAGWQRGGINALSYAFTDFFTSEEANRTAQDFARAKIAEIVKDPDTARALMPAQDIGTRRTCVDTGYFETYNLPHVHLVDVRADPIQRVTPDGIATASRHVSLDAIVFAIGFDAMTGAINAIDVTGRDGRSLRDAWADGPQTYLGLMTAGFPNLFFITGPQSPSVLSNMIVSIEQHIDWVADALAHLRDRGLDRIEATDEAQHRWVQHVNDLADETLYPRATSWYLGANIPGKPRVFMPYVGGCGEYRRECDDVVRAGYAGFRLDRGDDVVPVHQEEVRS